MTQAEIIRWAISAVKTKRIALWNGYEALKKEHPVAAENLWEEIRNLNEMQGKLEILLAKEEGQ